MGDLVSIQYPISANDLGLLDDINTILDSSFEKEEFGEAIMSYMQYIIIKTMNAALVDILGTKDSNIKDFFINDRTIKKHDSDYIIGKEYCDVFDKSNIKFKILSTVPNPDLWIIKYQVSRQRMAIIYRTKKKSFRARNKHKHIIGFKLELNKDYFNSLEELTESYLLEMCKDTSSKLLSTLLYDIGSLEFQKEG